MTPIDGRAIAHSSVMFPAKRAHLEHHRAGVGRRVEQGDGQPDLVVEGRGTGVHDEARASAAAVRSFVDVLPADPVIPMTAAPCNRFRASTPSAPSAACGSSTTTSDPSTPSGTWSTTATVAPRAKASATNS